MIYGRSWEGTQRRCTRAVGGGIACINDVCVGLTGSRREGREGKKGGYG